MRFGIPEGVCRVDSRNTPGGIADRRACRDLRGEIVSTVELTGADFERTITENEIVLVDFWAAWCGPCRMFAPIFEAASGEHSDVVFAKVDTEAEQELAGAAGIRSIPTLMAFKEGVLVFSQAGALPANALEQLIAAVRDLDVEKARAEAASQQDARTA